MVLVEKEWVSFGHKFQDRLGWSHDSGVKDDKEVSPIFVQWLDCVHQCVHQNPNDFEFNQEMILFVAKQVHSGFFSNFLFNCEKDAAKHRSQLSMVSVWTAVFSNLKTYTNRGYQVNLGLSVPVVLRQNIVLWNGYVLM